MKEKLNKHTMKQWISIQIVKNPSRVILTGIILVNMLFVMVSAGIISILAADYVDNHGFWASIYYTLTMIMDAGCVDNVIKDLGNTSGILVIICIIVIIVGMISFTGGIIGYVSNMIANFIENANTGKRPLKVSGHTIILNWNTKASEVINDMLYSGRKELVVVLVPENREEIEDEIENRILSTIAQENRVIREDCQQLKGIERLLHYRKQSFKRNLTVIVREGSPFSNKQLMDISIEKAKSVIILNKNIENDGVRYDLAKEEEQGNPITVKTMVLVTELTTSETSADNQKIVVEVEDSWTEYLINKVITQKENLKKANVTPIPVTKVLGQLLSQFAIMPELNMVYSELFSNKGASFYGIPDDGSLEVREYMKDHFDAIPLVSMDTKLGKEMFYVANRSRYFHTQKNKEIENISIKMNHNYLQPRRSILILGHNSKLPALMDGFEAYRGEWNNEDIETEILDISIIDDQEGLSSINGYKEYPYVSNIWQTNLYDQAKIYKHIHQFLDSNDLDKGILILSDDTMDKENLDTKALTFLIYVQDILTERRKKNIKERGEIDVIAEILDPKNYDVVRSYNVDNVIISNKYLSKMITQIGEKQALYEFFSDILTYDTEGCEDFTSMELYLKRVGTFFEEVPGTCTAASLIRAIYDDVKLHNPKDTTILLGYITKDKEMVLLCDDQHKTYVTLDPEDKLIVFSNH